MNNELKWNQNLNVDIQIISEDVIDVEEEPNLPSHNFTNKGRFHKSNYH